MEYCVVVAQEPPSPIRCEVWEQAECSGFRLYSCWSLKSGKRQSIPPGFVRVLVLTEGAALFMLLPALAYYAISTRYA